MLVNESGLVNVVKKYQEVDFPVSCFSYENAQYYIVRFMFSCKDTTRLFWSTAKIIKLLKVSVTFMIHNYYPNSTLYVKYQFIS